MNVRQAHLSPSMIGLPAFPNAAIDPVAKPDDPRHRLTPDHLAPISLPSPKGHISPVMIHTNFPPISLGLMARTHDRRNDFSMCHWCPFGDVAVVLSTCQIAAPSSSFSCLWPKTQKPAKANHALRVLGPGAFLLLTLSLCH